MAHADGHLIFYFKNDTAETISNSSCSRGATVIAGALQSRGPRFSSRVYGTLLTY